MYGLDILMPTKWPLYPKYVATISGFFKLEMIGKYSVQVKVATISDWPLYPWPLYSKSTVHKSTLTAMFSHAVHVIRYSVFGH